MTDHVIEHLGADEVWADVTWAELKVGDVFREMEEGTISFVDPGDQADPNTDGKYTTYVTMVPKSGTRFGPHVVLEAPHLVPTGKGTMTWGVRCEPQARPVSIETRVLSTFGRHPLNKAQRKRSS